MKFSIKDSFSKIKFLRTWWHLPKNSLMENFILGAVFYSFMLPRHTDLAQADEGLQNVVLSS